MSIDFTPISSWTTADVMHFARRAGFGVTPEQAATLAAQSPSTVIDGWVDGTTGIVGDPTLFNTVLGARADVVYADAADAANGGVAQPAVTSAHPFYVQGPNAWRSQFREGEPQAYWAFRMQYNPYALSERLALFFHNLFATGISKVGSNPLMLKQIDLFRTQGLGRFEDLVVAVSKDPAMCIWLDSTQNSATYSSIPNENYAREVMELYSLGVDNGYNQTDITNLARALSGWSYIIPPSGWVVSPANPQQTLVADGVFTVYQGQARPSGYRNLWGDNTQANLYLMHPTSASNSQSHSTTITYLGGTFDIVVTSSGQAPGESALRGIFAANPAGRRTNASEFLAKRLLLHFVTPNYSQSDYQDLASTLRTADFNLQTVLKALFKSAYFFASDKRYALVEGPVSWAVRATRMLCPDLATADGTLPTGMPANAGKAFPAWRVVVGDPYNPDTFDNMGMKLLDPRGPNGWKEHTGWLNSNTMRYRGRFAAALALGETNTTYYYNGSSYQPQAMTLFPNRVQDWFPSAPGNAQGAYDRLVTLLQPAPIPTAVRDAWLSGLFGANTTAVDTSLAADQLKLRELAFLILCSPSAQLY
jgi:uncharacterized protein (DUF1800 family)